MADASPNVAACIEKVESLKVQFENKQREAQCIKEQFHAAQKELEVALKDGTTGDWLRDQCIKGWGLEPAIEAAYREIHDKLAGHKGEFVLLAFDQEERIPGGFFREESYRMATCYRLGVLGDDKLVLIPSKRWDRHHSDQLGLPVTRFIEGEKEPFPSISKPKVVEAELFDPQHQDRDPPSFTRYIEERSGLYPASIIASMSARGPMNVELVVGNAAVKEWLRKAAMDDIYKPAAHALSMLELEPTDAT